MTLVQGWDISLNHGAIVQLRDGAFDRCWYYTDNAGSAEAQPYGSRLEVPTRTKQPDQQMRSAIRLEWVSRWLDGVLMRSRPDLAGLEDYAIRAEQGAHYLGEIGGQARRALWSAGIAFRLHDPIAVKMYVAHDGTAHKDLVEQCVRDRWKIDFGHCNAPQGKRKKPVSRGTSEDLADAFGMAKLVWTEFLLRTGQISLKSLHPKEIQVFNRATKTYPINLLGREWLKRPGESERFISCSRERCSLGELVSAGRLKSAVQQTLSRATERGRR